MHLRGGRGAKSAVQLRTALTSFISVPIPAAATTRRAGGKSHPLPSTTPGIIMSPPTIDSLTGFIMDAKAPMTNMMQPIAIQSMCWTVPSCISLMWLSISLFSACSVTRSSVVNHGKTLCLAYCYVEGASNILSRRGEWHHAWDAYHVRYIPEIAEPAVGNSRNTIFPFHTTLRKVHS